jgi:hypothetical protein
MFNRTSVGGRATYNALEYVCDSDSDIMNLPTDIPMGSTAFVISTHKLFMLNGDKEWVEV